MSPSALPPLVAAVRALRPGQKVRASFQHLDRPVVGHLRLSYNANVRPSEYLFLDVSAGHIVRDVLGRPGFGLRWLEVLPAGTTREEELERIDTLVDEYLAALEAWEQAPPRERVATLEVARAAYAACLEAMAPPFEVSA